VTAWCGCGRAAALEVSNAASAAACWEAVTGPDGDEDADGEDAVGDGDREETVGAGVDAAGWAGADRPDTATPDTTAAATMTTAPAASTGPRARTRRAVGPGSGPPGSPTVAGSVEPAPFGRSVATACEPLPAACPPSVPGCCPSLTL